MRDVTTEDLRSDIVQSIDGILGAPWLIRKLISPEHIRLLHALRSYAVGCDPSVLADIMKHMQREPHRSENES